jgi:branched-chain amino acid transport system substrate-binding protein
LESKFIAATGCVAAALALGVTACGSSDNGGGGGSSNGGGGGGSKSVTVYSSVPLQGASRASTADLVDGAKLALEQAGGKAGNIKVKYVSLDDSTAQAGNWTPEATSANARKAAADKSTAAYIGEFNSGASAVSIPILNEAGIPQVSPANTAVGLTTNKPGASPGEPEKYYPTGKRTYTRIVPIDTIQGAAMVSLMKQNGCTKLAEVNDKEVYGQGIAKNVELAAKSAGGLQVVMDEGIDPKAPNYRSLAQKAKGEGADCFAFQGVTANNAVQATKDFAAALGPNAKLFGPDGVCESGFVDPKKGGIPTSLDNRTFCTVATLPPDEYPASGQQFFTAFKQKYGESQPDPYAIYGYEAMNLALDAIKRSKTGERADILKALFDTKNRQSVLGTYSIDQNGDTTLTNYGAYKVKNGALAFDETIKQGQ